MLRSLFGFDWKKSPAHLLFLSKFLTPRGVEDFSESNSWESVLKEAPKKVIRRFFDEGMVEQASLAELLDHKYKATDLKAMLEKLGQKASGRKADLIERLIQANLDGMKQATSGLSVLRCSEQGRVLAEQYLMQDRERRTQLEQQTLQALRERRFKEASEMVSAFEAQQVFPRGVGVDWKHCNSARDVEMLKVMFNSRPKILGSLTDEQMAHLRVAAGMMYLWGTSQAENWLPDNFETELVMDNDAAARMISFHASHQFDIAQYHASGIKKVEVLATDNSCAACKKMAKRKYKLDEVPELPYEKCTSEMGCRCTIVVADF